MRVLIPSPETDSKTHDGRRRDSWLLATFAGTGIALVMIWWRLPLAPIPLATPDTLDGSWIFDLFIALQQHLVFGGNFFSTWGPLGFLMNMTDANRLLLGIAVVVQVTSAILLAYVVWRFLERIARRYGLGTAILTEVVLLLPGGPVIADASLRLYIIGLLLAAEMFYSTASRTNVRRIGLIAVLWSTSALIQDSLLVVVIVSTALSAYLLWQSRNGKLIVALLSPQVAVYGVTMMLLGGGSAALLRWPEGIVQYTLGYNSAMALNGPFLYLVLAGGAWAALIVLLVCAWRKSRTHWPLLLLLLTFAFEAFKQGFVRQDAHVYQFFSSAPWAIVMAFLVWLSVEDGVPMQQLHVFDWIVSCSVSFGLGLCFFVMMAGSTFPSIATIKTLSSTVHLVVSRATFSRTWSTDTGNAIAMSDGLAALAPLIKGTTAFAWPWNGNAVIAAGAREELAPMPQELTAFLPAFDKEDARYFSSAQRPEVGLMDLEAVDGRLPLQTAGATFRQLVSCYRPVATSGMFLLTQRTNAAPCPMVPLTSKGQWHHATLDQPLMVPSTPGRLTFLQIKESPSTPGVALGLVFRNSPLHLDVTYKNGTSHTFRLVNNTLTDGILVSTTLSNANELADLLMGAPANDVAHVAIVSSSTWQWMPQYNYRFATMNLPSPRLVNIRPGPPPGNVRLVGEHLDTVTPGRAAYEQGNFVWASGWFDIRNEEGLANHVRLGVQVAPGKVLETPYVRIVRPDVVKALGPGTPLLTGFAVWIPFSTWTNAQSLVVLWNNGRGTYEVGSVGST